MNNKKPAYDSAEYWLIDGSHDWLFEVLEMAEAAHLPKLTAYIRETLELIQLEKWNVKTKRCAR